MADRELVDLLKKGSEVWNAWRRENTGIHLDLSGADLSDANLSGANLSHTYLSDANLSGANLSHTYLISADLISADLSDADLSSAYLSSADLSRANLSYADLSGANLSRADLSHADLSGANLLSADLSYAYLLGANLSGANLLGANLYRVFLGNTHFDITQLANTVFADVDLSACEGLDTCIHHAPSSLGLDTILRSGGKIPEVFLRGCGVPEDFIRYLPSLLNQPIQFYSCFISYSHEDKAFARRLHDALQGHGIRCWLDEHQLLPGHDIYEEVDRGLRLWDKILLCSSEHSLKSWWVDNEIDSAFKKEQRLTKQRGKKVWALIPLNLDGYLFSGWENGKAEQVKSRLAADFKDWDKNNAIFEREFEKLVKALRTDGGRELPPVSLL